LLNFQRYAILALHIPYQPSFFNCSIPARACLPSSTSLRGLYVIIGSCRQGCFTALGEVGVGSRVALYNSLPHVTIWCMTPQTPLSTAFQTWCVSCDPQPGTIAIAFTMQVPQKTKFHAILIMPDFRNFISSMSCCKLITHLTLGPLGSSFGTSSGARPLGGSVCITITTADSGSRWLGNLGFWNSSTMIH